MSNLINDIENQIKGLKLKAQKQNVGKVVEIGDGVARIEGLSDAAYSEILDFGGGVYGLALNLEQYSVGAVIFGDFTKVKEGQEVKTTGEILQVPVGEGLVGRVVDALGSPIDGKGAIKSSKDYQDNHCTYKRDQHIRPGQRHTTVKGGRHLDFQHRKQKTAQ